MDNQGNNYTEEQKAIIAHRDGPAYVVAGAGTGKTFTMTARVQALIESGVAPEHILVLTFTNAAAREMVQRVHKAVGNTARKVTACTYHSFCNILMHRYGIPYRNYTILDEGSDEDLIKLVKANSIFADVKLPRASTLKAIYSKKINCCMSYEKILSNPAYEKYKSQIENIQAFHGVLQDYKEKHQLVNYDDMLVNGEAILKSQCGEHVRKQYQYVMVDEAQDTNWIQYEITKQLSSNIMYIGDPEQSIYGFRGSDLDLYLSVPKQFENTRIYTLSQNYRCTQEILDVANSVIAKDEIPYKAILKTGKGFHGERPDLCVPADVWEEAQLILEQLKMMGKEETGAVIYRNSIMSAKLELELVRNRMEYTKRGGIKFFEMGCIRDMMAIFRIVVNRNDNLAWFRILQKNRMVGEKRASQIIEDSPDPININPFRGKGGKIAKEICSQLDLLSILLIEVGNKDIQEQALCAERYYYSLLERNLEVLKQNTKIKESTVEAAGAEISTAKMYVPVLIDLMGEFPSIQGFLDSITLDMTVLPPDVSRIGEVNEGQGGNDSNIVLTTIHSAKGLEWDHVHIMDVIDGIFPNDGTGYQDYEEMEKTIAEERRCMYVAVTRAKKRLTLYCPENMVLYGRWYPGSLSRFLTDAQDQDLLQMRCQFGEEGN